MSSDIRGTLPSLERIERFIDGIDERLAAVVGYAVTDEAETNLDAARVLVDEVRALVVWVKDQVQALPTPILNLDPLQQAFAPAARHVLTAVDKVRPRAGDAFMDATLGLAPTMKGLTHPLRKAMLSPTTEVAALHPSGTMTLASYSGDDFQTTDHKLFTQGLPWVSYRVPGGSLIDNTSIATGVLIRVNGKNDAPLTFVPVGAQTLRVPLFAMNQDHGDWIVAHLSLANGIQIVAVLTPLDAADVVTTNPMYWPKGAIEAIATALYQNKAILVQAFAKDDDVAKLPAGTGIDPTTAQRVMNQMDAVRKAGGMAALKPQIVPPPPSDGSALAGLDALIYRARKEGDMQRADEMKALRDQMARHQSNLVVKAQPRRVDSGDRLMDAVENLVRGGVLAQSAVNGILAEAVPSGVIDWAQRAPDDPPPQLTLLPAGESPVQQAAHKRAEAVASKRADEDRLARIVFSYWQDVMRKPRAIFDDRRKTRIITRLRENSGDVGELLYAIDGAEKDDWLMGRDPKSNGKKYNDIDTIFRDRAQVEKLAETMKGYLADKTHPVVDALDVIDRGDL